jgi:hypothetical protein
MTPARHVADGVDPEAGDEHAAGVRRDHLGLDDLVGQHDDLVGRDRGFLGHADRAPDMRVAVAVRALHHQERDVGLERRHQRHGIGGLGERVVGELDPRVRLHDVGAQDRLDRHVGQPIGAGEERHGDGEIGIVVDLDPVGHAVLGGAAKIVAHAARNIADPGPRDLGDAADADEKIGEDVGDRRDDVEAAASLAHQLVHRRIRDAVLERGAENDAGAIRHIGGDGVLDAAKLVLHGRASPTRQRPPGPFGAGHLSNPTR